MDVQERNVPALPALSDSVELGVANQLHNFPLLIQRKQDNGASRPMGAAALLELWTDHREWLDMQLHQSGALLFRGFGISEQGIFQSVIAQFKEQLLDYVDGNSPRTKIGGGVYTSTEYPPEYFISVHNELSYCAQWPARLFFCCILEPGEGGQTPLVDSQVLLQKLPPALVDEFRKKQVKYVRNLHGGQGFGPSWQKTFETTNRAEVESYALASGAQWEWDKEGSLRISNVRPATAIHPVTGREVWFNQADQFHPSTLPADVYQSMVDIYDGCEDQLPQNATFGDTTPIPVNYLETIRAVTKAQLVLFDWRQGDLLMVDNMLVAHGRMPFKGQRRILVAMTAE